MNVDSRSPYKTTRTLNKLIGAFVIAHDVERALVETGLTEEELEKIVGRYPPSHKNANRLKGRITNSHLGVQIRGGYGDKVIWTKQKVKQE